MILKTFFNKLTIILIVLTFSFATINAQSDIEKEGMNLFDGSQGFENGGPSCISCHNVTNDNLMAGGLFAKDLTDIYGTLGVGLEGWLANPPYPAMAVSYANNELTETERKSLTAFFNYANQAKDSQKANSGYFSMLIYGLIGLVILLAIFQLLWGKRKTAMTKQDIFDRSMKASDAKF